MEISLTADQKSFARQAIGEGRYPREEDAVREALSLWEERERRRAELLIILDAAQLSLAKNEGRIITRESMNLLASEVKQRGRTRLASEDAKR